MRWFPLIGVAGLLAIPLLKKMRATAREHRLIKQTIHLDRLPEAFDNSKLFFISDVHRRIVSPHLLKEVGKCDLVIIGGDLLEKGVSLNQVKENLRAITSCGPTYFVWGNNDVEVDEQKFRSLLQESGVTELMNEGVVLERENQRLFLAGGVEPLRKGLHKELVDQATAYSCSFFVCHFPEAFKELSSNHPFSFLLSGHTHGGQIRIFGLGPAPRGYIKKVNEAVQLVSNGYGTSKLPLRLGALPETHLFTLKSGPTSIEHPIVYNV
ncbi:metallophosphoesterase [Alkalihalobacillus sp. NPDC078783]